MSGPCNLDGIDLGGGLCPLEPMNGFVCIRQAGPEEKTSGGIFLPDTAKKKHARGVVVALPVRALDYRPDSWREGVDERMERLDLAVGDTVVYQRHADTEVEIDGETYLLVMSMHLVARIRGKERR